MTELQKTDSISKQKIMEIFKKYIVNHVVIQSFDFRNGVAIITLRGKAIEFISLGIVKNECQKARLLFNPNKINTIGKSLVIYANIDKYDESDIFDITNK